MKDDEKEENEEDEDSYESSDGEEIDTIQQKMTKVEIEFPPNRGNGMDFSFFTRQMLDETNDLPKGVSVPFFNRKPLLQISKLRLMREQGNHLEKNKLSEKMGRRDVRFYDLFKKHRFEDDVSILKNQGFHLEGVLAGVYTDPVTKK